MEHYYWLYITVMLIGLLGAILPLLPGIPLIFLAIFIYSWNTGFATPSMPWLLFFAALTVLSWLVDYFSGIIGSKQAGLSRFGFWGMLLGIIIGFFTTPAVLLSGPIIGMIFGELLSGKDNKQIFQTFKATIKGFVAGFIFKVFIALIMISLFIYLT